MFKHDDNDVVDGGGGPSHDDHDDITMTTIIKVYG